MTLEEPLNSSPRELCSTSKLTEVVLDLWVTWTWLFLLCEYVAWREPKECKYKNKVITLALFLFSVTTNIKETSSWSDWIINVSPARDWLVKVWGHLVPAMTATILLLSFFVLHLSHNLWGSVMFLQPTGKPE